MQRPPAAVTATKVTVRDVPYYIDEIGRTAALESVSIMPQVAGRVDSAPFVEGAVIKKGDLLFTIDPRPFEAALAQAEAAKLQNIESLKLAKSEFARVDALKGTSAVSQTEYDQKESAVAVAEAQVKAAQAAIDTAKLNLEYCTIRSPLTGRSGLRLVDPGNVVKANEGALVMVQSVDPINADFTIPEDRLAEVRQNMARGTLQTIVEIPQEAKQLATSQPSTQQSESRTGELKFLDNSVQDGSGTIKLRAVLQNSDGYFWPGQFVRIRLVLYTQKQAILIPSGAVQIGQQGSFVYVLKADDTAELRVVTPGQRQGEMVVIDNGLKADERVIVTGQMMVMPGAKVAVQTDGPAPAAAAGNGEVKS